MCHRIQILAGPGFKYSILTLYNILNAYIEGKGEGFWEFNSTNVRNLTSYLLQIQFYLLVTSNQIFQFHEVEDLLITFKKMKFYETKIVLYFHTFHTFDNLHIVSYTIVWRMDVESMFSNFTTLYSVVPNEKSERKWVNQWQSLSNSWIVTRRE